MINDFTADPLYSLSLFILILQLVSCVWYLYASMFESDTYRYPYYQNEPGYMAVYLMLSRHTIPAFLSYWCVNYLQYNDCGLFFVTFSFTIIAYTSYHVLLNVLWRWQYVYVNSWTVFMFNWLISQTDEEYAIKFANSNTRTKISLMKANGWIHDSSSLGNFSYLLNINGSSVNNMSVEKNHF